MKHLKFKVDSSEAGIRLDQWLAQKKIPLGGGTLSKTQARRLIQAGAVYLNRKRTKVASKLLREGAHVDVYLDEKRMASPVSQEPDFTFSESQILYRDESILLVNKPAGIPAQPTLDGSRPNLFEAIQKGLKRMEGSDPYVGLHHRLDRDTSGVMIFTLSRDANGPLSQQFADHTLQKTYLAICKGTPPSQWEVKNFLGRLPGKRARFGAVRSGGKPAHTLFSVLASGPRGALVKAVPITGRTHQIRVHLAEGGWGIVGDPLYGVGAPGEPQGMAGRRTMLHAHSLTFVHPVIKNERTIVAPLPQDFLECLKSYQIPWPNPGVGTRPRSDG